MTVELSELDADLWEAFKRGGAWVAHSEYMKLKADNAKLRELVAELYEDQCDECDRWKYRDRMRELGVDEC